MKVKIDEFSWNFLIYLVVLGKIHKINKDDPSLVKPPTGFNSVLASGTIAPDEKKDYKEYEFSMNFRLIFRSTKLSITDHPVMIPQGEIKNTGLSSSF
jgi:hypothetical protein